MGGLRGGVTGGLEKSNPLIIMYLAKNRGGLAKKINNSQFTIRLLYSLNTKQSTLNTIFR